MKNLTEFNEFRGKKRGSSKINETVMRMDDIYRVRQNIDIPVSLVNAYIKKVKDESGKNIRELYSDMELAEMLGGYMVTSYMNIENFPATIAIGTEGGAQVQPKVQGQGQSQAPETQTQTTQTQAPAQNVQAQSTASQVPSTEGGQSQTPPPQGGQTGGQATQGGGQTGGQATQGGQKTQGGGQATQAI